MYWKLLFTTKRKIQGYHVKRGFRSQSSGKLNVVITALFTITTCTVHCIVTSLISIYTIMILIQICH